MISILQIVFSISTLFHQPSWTDSSQYPYSPADAPPSKSVAVIGSGTAGLAMLKTLLDLPGETRTNWEIVLYEQRRDLGGIWLPDLHPPLPPDLPETPLYPLLHTNTPHPSMTFPGFVFPPYTALYPSHEYVEQYHQDYATHFNLLPYIRFNHTVIATSWKGDSQSGYWNVTVQDNQKKLISKAFDHLVVANGHNHYPYVPVFAGQDAWLAASPHGGPKREIIHSIWYKGPERYVNRSVVIVGSGASGRDAASQISTTARKTYHSVRDNNDLPTGPITQISEISHFTSDAIVFADGSSLSDPDAVLLGTGYELRIPFLEDGHALYTDPSARSNASYTQGLVTNLRYLFPLYQHIVSLCPNYPVGALHFIGLPIFVANAPCDIAQSLFAAHVIANASLLPPREDLLAELAEHEQALRDIGLDPYYIGHRLVNGTSQDYQDEIVDYLKEKGAMFKDGKKFVELWRRDIGKRGYLKRGWQRIEELGTQLEWLEGIESEADWVDLMRRVNEWQKEWESVQGIEFKVDWDLV